MKPSDHLKENTQKPSSNGKQWWNWKWVTEKRKKYTSTHYLDEQQSEKEQKEEQENEEFDIETFRRRWLNSNIKRW